jgi:predicted histidine transporter YuiF (NhaC family)
MNGNPFLISNPSAMEWLIGLAYIVILGLVAAVVVWRTHRAYKNLRSKSNRKGKSSDERP